MEEKSTGRKSLNLKEIRTRLAQGDGRKAWRSLDEIVETDEFLEFLQEEFPRQATLTGAVNNLSRRDFLKLIGASLALGGLTACMPQPEELILPYNEAPDALVPGKPLYFATAMQISGYARGLVAKSTMGRPIKVEGNPDHPASLGATDVFAQGSVLGLYDPERSQVITNQGQIRTWDSFQAAMNQAAGSLEGAGGAGLRLLTGVVTSPTLKSQIDELLDRFPQAKWYQFEPVNRDNVTAGSIDAFGEPVETVYDFSQANVILSLDDDFTFVEPGNLRYVHDFSARRQVTPENPEMNRLYVVESNFSNAGAVADHRLALPAHQIEAFGRVLANQLGLDVGALPGDLQVPDGWIDALADDLRNNQGSCLVLAGPQQPAGLHSLVHAINEVLGNVGQTVFYTDPVRAEPAGSNQSLLQLAQELAAGDVELLIVLDGNPVYTAPADLDLAENFAKAGTSVYLGLYNDETAELSTWHIPATHYLEMWSDTRAFDGTTSIVQPLILPLYNGKSPHELLAVFTGSSTTDGYQIVRSYWQNRYQGGDFESFWRQTLNTGVIPDTRLETREISFQGNLQNLPELTATANAEGLEIIFMPDPSVWDGGFTNIAWLQELPKPMTKITWDNAALISPSLAENMDLTAGDVVELQYQGRSVEAPVWILPGLPANSVVVHLGYGRTAGGSLASGTGFNAYNLRTTDRPWFDNGLEVRKTGRHYTLATTQNHQTMEGRDLVRTANIEEFREDPHIFEEAAHGDHLPSLYEPYEYTGYSWGMTINLNTCIGCNACVIACQAENNIPVVGKEQVDNGREMFWIRVDRYFEFPDGNLDQPETYFEPVPCMHCEHAPCEPVCPVIATVHDEMGLNEMIYNRCVGTRYCSNNCPYKVRRFNFLQFTDEETIPLKLMRNPEVTVRSRGVMEKCTYCIQRIKTAIIEAEAEGREVRDGELQTACQQVCPANAITFGNLNDENSEVARLKKLPQNYALLAEIGTVPRTTYLANFRNPNPQIG